MTTRKLQAGIEVIVWEDQFSAGRHPEDGTQVIGEVYYVVIEFENGARLKHSARFANVAWVEDRSEWCDFGGYFERDWEGKAKAACERLAAKVRAAGRINPDHWEEMYAAYGSPAFSNAEQIEWERQIEEQERIWK